jgi:hypothetical protein
MALQLTEHPLANDRPFTRMMQYVHLPKSEEHFPGYFLYVILHIDNRSR